MTNLYIRLSADEHHAAVVEVAAGGLQWVQAEDGRLKELRVPAAEADALAQAFEKEGVAVARVPGEQLTALFLRHADNRAFRNIFEQSGFAPQAVHCHAALVELMGSTPEVFRGLLSKDDFLKAANFLQKAMASATVEIVATVEGEAFSYHCPPVFATAEEVGRGRLAELEESIAEVVAPSQHRGR